MIGFRVLVEEREIAAVRVEVSVIKIGRMTSAQVCLDDASVSRMHCVVECQPSPSVIDLGSEIGTLVNGDRVNKHQLEPGDRIGIGPFTLVVATTAELATGTWYSAPIKLTRQGLAGAPPPVSPVLVFTEPPPAQPAPITGLPPELAHLEALPTAPTPLVMTPDPSMRPVEMFNDPASRAMIFEVLGGTSDAERAIANQLAAMLIVGVDKAREHRGRDTELGKAYDAIVECFAIMGMPRLAPSLLIELTNGIPDLDEDERHVYATTIARHDAVWPHLAALANLPGFARPCAVAAEAAGREPLPWLDFEAIGAPATGIQSRCADYRAWSIEQLDREPPDDIDPDVLTRALSHARDVVPPDRLVLDADALESIYDQERCEALAALAELEELGKKLKASSSSPE